MEYDIIRPLGKGSYGEVSEVFDQKTGKRWAMKRV